uniref:NADH:ubiquinone reductase (H(+)-translocating) n=1 Tax=Chrysaora quinquecirrha TaxID=6148 RepID=G8DM08_CHRQI|nr:NADH dehydrogenase subunit 2 [Chrysaora quinquecirrha]ADY15494.1 NADH dehydrogenase subunit 2 [Chrysaora quinquecirrha]
MNYFHLEFLIGTLLLISLLIYLSPTILNFTLIGVALMIIFNYSYNYEYSSWEMLLKTVLIVTGFFIYNSLNIKSINSVGVLILSVILASLLVVSSNNLLALYISIELQSLSLFILIARKKSSIDKVEAALKYFVLSSISSGLFLIGSAIFFCSYGTCAISDFSADSISIGKVLVTVALLFKLAAAPLHIWTPDVYQGCDNNSLMVLGTLPKISVLAILIALIPNTKLILLSTILSLIIGCVGALNQTNIKKLLAYSGIINMGFILLGVSTSSFVGIESSIMYLLIYTFTFLSFLFIINNFLSEKSNISEFSGFLGINSAILITLLVFVFSLAGIPPFAGFFIKWVVLSNAISYNFIFTSVISILCAVIAGVYYVRLVKIGYFQQDKSFHMWKEALLGHKKLKHNESVILGSILFLTISIVLCPHILTELVHLGVLSIY